MAIGDELDKLLADDRLLKEDWEGIEKVLGVALPTESHVRRTLVSKEIRHNYGHTLMNPFREWYEPDYAEIVRATAEKLKINVKDHHSVSDIEDRILSEVIDQAKENIIKEYGQAAWDEIENKIIKDIDETISKGYVEQGFLLPDDIEALKRARANGVMVMLMTGKITGAVLYTILNQAFSSMAIFMAPRMTAIGVAPTIVGSAFVLLPVLAPVLWPWLFISDLGNTNWKKTIPAVVVVASYRRKFGLA